MNQDKPPSSSAIEGPFQSSSSSYNDLGKRTILIVDDEPEVALYYSTCLTSCGYRALLQMDPREVLRTLDTHAEIELILLDLRMPYISGESLLNQIKTKYPSVGVIITTGYSTIDSAVRMIKSGAHNYLAKPLTEPTLEEACATFFSNRPAYCSQDPRFSRFITTSPLFEGVFKKILAFADVDSPVLITGETGTGKELVAMQLHAMSSRHSKKFTGINIAAVSPSLFESLLFGHKKGAFTGAERDHAGFFEQAADGTIFLDEIGEIGLDEQKKLLRVLQTRRFNPVGSTLEQSLNAKIIFATNRDLRTETTSNRFRSDLYYRLAGHIIELPALRDRREDIDLLAKFFLEKYCIQYRRHISGFSEEALQALNSYSYPGNVRELEGYISASILLEGSDKITRESLPKHLTERSVQSALPSNLDAVRIQTIMTTLKECEWNKTLAAKRLGVSRSTIIRAIKDMQLSRAENN